MHEALSRTAALCMAWSSTTMSMREMSGRVRLRGRRQDNFYCGAMFELTPTERGIGSAIRVYSVGHLG